MDTAPPHSPDRPYSPPAPDGVETLGTIQAPQVQLKDLSGLEIHDLWREAEADSFGLGKDELATVLLTLGVKYNYGQPPGTAATRPQITGFWQSLQLRDLALAHACALGRESAWRQFMTRYRDFLIQAATGITSSAALGRELADSLYADLFGLTDRGEQRRSPLAYYSGRGSLRGFLKATLAQRYVDHHRRTKRETPLTSDEIPAVSPGMTPTTDMLSRLGQALGTTLGSLAAEDRFVLSAWFLDRRTLLEISRVLGVHEATVSRRLQRLTGRLHDGLLENLQASGLSRAAAEEALATDPRDLDVNLRLLLQASHRGTFLEQAAATDFKGT
ncbi:MAG TPA: sigma-70 family RNA polymerase sigma factor [Bryobacteraceae bacterium]|nr:sigma-70 family RNA polymerase sigma factor [Bryobacteraceae bacterium]